MTSRMRILPDTKLDLSLKVYPNATASITRKPTPQSSNRKLYVSYFAVAAYRKYLIYGMDAVTAFLNSILKETIYVKQAEGFVDPEHPDWVYLLGKALYGLKQSALEWYNTLRAVLESDELQFKRIESDHAVFVLRTELSTVYLALFVDDMAIFGDDEVLIREIKAKLSSHFKMKDLGIMKHFLGLEI